MNKILDQSYEHDFIIKLIGRGDLPEELNRTVVNIGIKAMEANVLLKEILEHTILKKTIKL